MKKIYTREYFVRKGKEGAKARNEKHDPSEISKKGWDTRRAKLDTNVINTPNISDAGLS